MSSNTHPQGPPISSTAVKVHRCTVEGCEKTFSRKSNLKAHMRLHTGEEPYACPDCGKKFKWKSCMASHERVHSRRTDHPLTASAYARRAELQHASPARRRNQHTAAEPVVGRASDAFVAQLQLQQANQWQHAQRQHEQPPREHLFPHALRQQQTQQHLQEQQRISREERLQYYEGEQRLMQLQEQFHLTENRHLTQPSSLRRTHDYDPNSDTQQYYTPPSQQYFQPQQPHLQPHQSPKAPNPPHHPYHSTFQHEQAPYSAANAPKHGELSYPPPQGYAADPITYPQPTYSQPLSEPPNSAIPSHEYADLLLQARRLSLLGYFNTSATDSEIVSRRHLSTEMTPIEHSPGKSAPETGPYELTQVRTGDHTDIPETENVEYEQDGHLKPANTPVPGELEAPSTKPSDDVLCSSDITPTDPANSNGSMDFNFCRPPKFHNEEMEMIPYFNKEFGSQSASDRPMSIESKIFGDASPDVGLSYFSREPSAPLDRLSGELKYNGNGKWSCNMSDILNVGVEPGRSGSLGHLSLILPELGNGMRGTYSSSVSPLGMTLTNPSASPRTSVAYIRRAFHSPHVSQSFSIADK